MRKKIYYFVVLLFSLSILFTGCSNDESINLEEESMSIESSAKNINVRSAGDGKNDLLGHGYDFRYAMGDNWKGGRNRVIDVERFLEGDAIDPVTGNSVKFPKGKVETSIGNGSWSQSTISGTSLEEFDRHINQKISVEFEGSILPTSIFNWGKTEISKEFDENYNTKVNNSFFKSDLKRDLKILKFSATTNRLKYFLTEEFAFDLWFESAEDLVKMYGTHVLTDITVGGKLSVYVTAEVKDNVKHTVETFHADLLAKLKADNVNDVKIHNNMTNTKVSIAQHGGVANQTISASIDQNGYLQVSGYDYKAWLTSVTNSKSSLIECNIETIIPLWDLIVDPIKKQEVFEVIKKRLNLECTSNLVEYRWNDTFVINNNPNNNGGRKFVSYQWYQNDVAMPGDFARAQSISLSANHLMYYRTYHCVAVTDKGEVVKTCGMVATK